MYDTFINAYFHHGQPISSILTLPVFPRPFCSTVQRSVSSWLEWQSAQPYLVQPVGLINNIITFTWPCHASYRRWISPCEGHLSNVPHLNLKMGLNHLSIFACSIWCTLRHRAKKKRKEEKVFLHMKEKKGSYAIWIVKKKTYLKFVQSHILLYLWFHVHLWMHPCFLFCTD